MPRHANSLDRIGDPPSALARRPAPDRSPCLLPSGGHGANLSEVHTSSTYSIQTTGVASISPADITAALRSQPRPAGAAPRSRASQFGITAIANQQLVMGAAFDDAPLVHDDDLIGVAD